MHSRRGLAIAVILCIGLTFAGVAEAKSGKSGGGASGGGVGGSSGESGSTSDGGADAGSGDKQAAKQAARQVKQDAKAAEEAQKEAAREAEVPPPHEAPANDLPAEPLLGGGSGPANEPEPSQPVSFEPMLSPQASGGATKEVVDEWHQPAAVLQVTPEMLDARASFSEGSIITAYRFIGPGLSGEWQSAGTLSLDALGPGLHVIRVDVRDAEGHIDSVTQTIVVGSVESHDVPVPWWVALAPLAGVRRR